MTQLFKVTPTKQADYDEYEGFVVRANSAEQAVEIATRLAKQAHADQRFRARPVNSDGRAGVILEAFRYG